MVKIEFSRKKAFTRINRPKVKNVWSQNTYALFQIKSLTIQINV